MAGLTAGVLEAILVNPFEVVKVSLQANKSKWVVLQIKTELKEM